MPITEQQRQLEDRRLTNSQMATAKNCLRKHYLAYVFGIRRDTEAQALRMGAAFHAGRDAYVLGQDADEAKCADKAILVACRDYDAQAASLVGEQQTDWLVEREIIARMLAGYFWRWSEFNRQIKVIASELSFEVPIVNPETSRAMRLFSVAGKLDALIELPDGRIAVNEHKTCGQDISVGSDYCRRLRIDSQISLYFLAAQSLGHNVSTIWYDVTRKPSIRPKKLSKAIQHKVLASGEYCGEKVEISDPLALERETPTMYGARLRQDMADRPDFYFAHYEVARLEADLQEARYELWQMAKLLRDCERFGRWPRNTQACIGFGRCPYFDLCTNGYDPQSAEVPKGYIRVDNIHQELGDE